MHPTRPAQRGITLAVAAIAAITVAGGALAQSHRRRESHERDRRRTHGHGPDARRDSDHQRHRRRWEQTLDPTEHHGHPITVPRTSTAVAFAPPPPAPTSHDAAARPYDLVVIVSLDGLRPDAIDMTDAPNLRLLRSQGANALESRTITHSYTLPSHTSMLTGVDTDRHGLIHNNFVPSRGFVRVPTVFYYAHDEGLATAMFVSKPKLRHLALPGSVDVFSRPSYACGPVVNAAARYLAHASPGITFVHLSEPDEFGHSRGWMTEAYLRGVATADRCMGTLLAGIAQRTDLDRVLILVSADHGGHGRTHGSTRDDDMRIPWIAWGSRVIRGPFRTPISTMDTAATALAALGVPVPADLVGRPVAIALGQSAATELAAPDAGVPPTEPGAPASEPEPSAADSDAGAGDR